MSYVTPPKDESSPYPIAARLIQGFQEFEHLKDGEPRIGFLYALKPVVKQGRQIIGQAHIPSVQGQLKGVFDWLLAKLFDGTPDFLITLDNEYWQDADARTREILVFHELSHCVQKTDKDGDPRFDEEGRTVWGLQSHDVEEFKATVARYGAHNQELREFIAAAGTIKP